jgi:acetolactate synthase-1/2/3 large subunit
VCGDGDFLMNGQEIATAVAHGGKPLVIVVDNGIYGTIVQHQEKHYPGRPSGTRMANPDFKAWMESFGGHGERVETTEAFAPALDRALAADAPALIHVLISSEVMPPAPDEIAG